MKQVTNDGHGLNELYGEAVWAACVNIIFLKPQEENLKSDDIDIDTTYHAIYWL